MRVPPRQNSCRLDRIDNPRVVVKDESGAIRTGIQRQGRSAVAAARERIGGTLPGGSLPIALYTTPRALVDYCPE